MIIHIDKKPENMSQEQWDNLTKVAEQYFQEDFKNKNTATSLSDKQIKKALKCCAGCNSSACDDCPCNFLGTNCEGVSSEALEYINRLETENSKLTAETERLKEFIVETRQCDKELKTEAVKEFASELTKKLNNLTYNPKTSKKTVTVDELKEQVDWVLHEVVLSCINTLVKEKESEV